MLDMEIQMKITNINKKCQGKVKAPSQLTSLNSETQQKY